MTNSSEDSSAHFSINDFQDQIIEMFAPDLSLETLNTLRLVSKRFYSVFNHEKFWKRCLYYPENQYLCDTFSNSKIQNVKEVLDEFNEKKVNKFKGYCKLQSVHLYNWNYGKICSFDSLQLTPLSVLQFEEAVDDLSQRWMIFSVDENIHLWNITSIPWCLEPFFVGFHSSMHVVSSDRILIEGMTFDINDGLIKVYTFENHQLNLQYMFIYYMESVLDPQILPSLRSCPYFCYVVVGNYFLGYDYKITNFQDDFLHIWNLDSNSKLGSFSLFTLDLDNEFKSFVKAETVEEIDITVKCKGCRISLYPVENHNVILVLKYKQSYYPRKLCQINIFNVESMRNTHFIDQVTFDVVSCSMSHDVVSVVATSHVINYNISPITESVPYSYGEQFTFIECDNNNNDNIVFKNSKMLIKSGCEVNVVSLRKKSLETKTVNVPSGYSILAFLEPNLLLVYDSNAVVSNTTVKVLNIVSNKEIFIFENVNVSRRFLYYYRNLQYFAKLVLNFHEEQYFRVLNY